MRASRIALASLALVAVTAARLQTWQSADATAAAIQKINDEALTRSQLTRTVRTLTDLYGPRLTGSPNLKAAAEYVVTQLKSWRLDNAGPELWGPFGPGWSNDRFSAMVVSPLLIPLIAYPKAWTPGTPGAVSGEAVIARLERDEDFERYRGRLRGKFVLTAPLRPINDSRTESENESAFARRRMAFLVSEDVAALLEPGPGRSGTVVVGDGRVMTAFEAGMYPWPDPVPPQVVLASEHFSWMTRLLESGDVPVVLELNIANSYYTAEPNSFNVIAEIRGDSNPDQVVMIGAHLDSAHVGTGAVDNAAGSAVVLEAMRILRATRLPMRRTVRMALWTGSEQGLQGSRAYVAKHFVSPTLQRRPGDPTLFAYFDVDDGTGRFRGIYAEGNHGVVPIFEQWMLPFAASGMKTVSLDRRPGKDHAAFDAAGLNGFHFMQDGVDRAEAVRQSNFDGYDRLEPEALIQNAAIVAAFAFSAANWPGPLPRKPPTP